MGNRKLTKEGQAQRRQALIDFIRDNGPVTSSVICEHFHMRRSSLADDIQAINTSGEVIRCPKKGIYELNKQSPLQNTPYSKIDRKGVRRWMIFFALREGEMTRKELLEYYTEAGIPCSESILYRDIRELEREGLLTSHREGNERYYHADCLVETDRQEIAQYFRRKAYQNARISISAYQSIDRKVRSCASGIEADLSTADEAGHVRTAGKKNILTEEQLALLQDFGNYPYKEKELVIVFHTSTGKSLTRDFQTGLIVYSVETSRIYLLGYNLYGQESIIPLDQIISVKAGTRINQCWDSPIFHRIFRQMFQVSIEEPEEVRIRFENRPFILEKVKRLCKSRNSAKIQCVEGEIAYTDSIRGEADFARYLRRFGRSVIVDEPDSLRKRMIRSSKLVLEAYEQAEGESE